MNTVNWGKVIQRVVTGQFASFSVSQGLLKAIIWSKYMILIGAV